LFDFFHYWSEVLWISYQNHSVQQNRSFQLLFNVRLYQLSTIFQNFPSHWKLNNLYIHNVLAHSSEYFEKTDLLLLSCEFGEQAFSRLTHFVKTKSNHKIQDLYKIFLIYEQTSLLVSRQIKDASSSSEKIKKKLMRNFHEKHFKDYQDFSIPFLGKDVNFLAFLKIVNQNFQDLIDYKEEKMFFKVSEGICKHYKEFF
jgi:hypothetical protein